jgi:hypothetical protein
VADPDSLTLSIIDDSPDGGALLTIPGGIGLYRKRAAIDLSLTIADGFAAEARFEGCYFQVRANGDLFISQLLPGTQNTQPFDVVFHWDKDGVSFAGSAMLEITLPVQAQLPVVKIQALHLIIQPVVAGDPNVSLELSVDLTGDLLGVISAEVQRIGITTHFFLSPAAHPDAIRFGPVAATADFKAPTGAGLAVNLSGILNGGGYLRLEPDIGRYSGILSMNLFGIGVTADAIIVTRPSFALLLVLTADFRPVGIDLGFGFTLNAVGGIVGLNRAVDLDALSLAVRNNAVSSILFPSDPIGDAPRILSDLDRLFPPAPGQFLIGPMLQLGWGKPTGMITLSLAVIVQVPDLKIAIAGILRVLVPPLEDEALLRLQVNLTGGIDFSRQFLWLDGSLYDSRLLMYVLEGDMAGRLRWGSGADFAASVGGFNPRYVPAADLDIPPMKRVTINLLPTSDNPRLRILSYYAVTSNTLQHGAAVDAYAAALGFSIRGWLGYDLLAQVNPLHFEVDFGGGVAVYDGDDEILGTSLSLHLSGPSPWHVDGEATFTVIIKIHVPVHAQFGGDDAPSIPVVDVSAIFRGELTAPRNWTATLPDQSQLLVTLAPNLSVGGDQVLAHPSATIQFNQSSVPLKVTLEQFFGAKPKPSTATFFDLTGIKAGSELAPEVPQPTSEFAPAQYFNLSNDDRLSAHAFEPLASGIRANGASLVKWGLEAPRNLVYGDNIIDPLAQDSPFAEKFAYRSNASESIIAGLGGCAVGRSSLFADRMARQPSGDEVKLPPDTYQIVDSATLAPAAGAAYDSHVAARQALAALAAQNPAMAGRLTIVSAYELG